MPNQNEPADVLVIGAGAAGGAFTWRLSEAGLTVVCLEHGRWGRPNVSAGPRDDRQPRQLNGWSRDPDIRRRAEDYTVDSSESQISPLMHSGVGGTTAHWSGLCDLFHPSDFHVNPLLRGDGRHLMGTARIGDDPEASVLDLWGQARDADNLFVIDGSAFVTSAAVSPTATIQALALRTADYIVQERTDLKS